MYKGTRIRGNFEEYISAQELKHVDNDKIKQFYCKYCFEPAYNLKYKNKEFTKCPTCKYSTFTNLFNSYTDIPTISRIGCEMEGYFQGRPRDSINAPRGSRVTYHQDCSVHINDVRSQSSGRNYCAHCDNECDCGEDDRDGGYCEDSCYCDELRGGGHTGEYVTDPIVYTSDLEEFSRIVLRNYPQEVNSSCGGHFHISFNDERCYAIAQTKRMYHQFRTALMNWATKNLTEAGRASVNRRLNGHRYCERGHDADAQVIQNGNRYYHFNFCWNEHRTLEVRVLPMFQQAETYVSAVKFCTNWIDSFIKNEIKNQRPVKEKAISFKGKIVKSDLEKYYLKRNKEPISFIEGGI